MKIALLGDIALIGKFDRTKNKDVVSLLGEVKEYISDCDYVVANLEAIFTATTRTNQCKGVYLRTDPSNIETILSLGITHVTLANNHCHDYGKKALEENLLILRNNMIQYVGLNHSPCIIEKGHDRAVLSGFCCYSSNGLYYGYKEGELTVLSMRNLEKFLTNSKTIQAYPIISAHYGIEGVHYPAVEHIKLFRKFAEEYDFTLHGHHPHVIQGIEIYKKSLLAYSLGNFCFGTIDSFSMKNQVPEELSLENRNTTVIKLLIDGSSLTDYEYTCFLIDDEGYFRESIHVEEEQVRHSSALKMNAENYKDLRKMAILEIRSLYQWLSPCQ